MRPQRYTGTITSVDSDGLNALPRAYRLGLQLRALGADDELIADCLDVDVDSVHTLLDIGARKLENLRRAAHRADGDHQSDPEFQ